eukprot:2804203-Amphidinium_carterae.1
MPVVWCHLHSENENVKLFFHEQSKIPGDQLAIIALHVAQFNFPDGPNYFEFLFTAQGTKKSTTSMGLSRCSLLSSGPARIPQQAHEKKHCSKNQGQ